MSVNEKSTKKSYVLPFLLSVVSFTDYTVKRQFMKLLIQVDDLNCD